MLCRMMSSTKKPPTEKGRKRSDAVLAAASELFLAHGYDGVRLDDVIAEAGGSKISLYRSFGDKEKLFEACVRRICAGYEAEIRQLTLTGRDDIEKFHGLAVALVEMAISERQLRFYRLVMGNSTRFPVIGRIWYESGLLTIKEAARDFLGDLPWRTMTERELDVLASALHGALVFRLLNEAAVLGQQPDAQRIADTVDMGVAILQSRLSSGEPWVTG